MSETKPEAWTNETDWQKTERRGEGDNGEKKGKRLVNEHVWMTHGHGQQSGNWLWEPGVGWTEDGKGG